jgi:hypothetical protein
MEIKYALSVFSSAYQPIKLPVVILSSVRNSNVLSKDFAFDSTEFKVEKFKKTRLDINPITIRVTRSSINVNPEDLL